MKKLFAGAVALLLTANFFTVWAWGPKGHDIVAYIAWSNMTPEARAEVSRALEGRTMTYYSSWMDNVRDLPEFGHTSTWHYANVDEGETYETMIKEPAGDVFTATTWVVEQLERRDGLTDSLENLYLRYLIHMVGDMHCPMHAGRLSDRGGNDFKIRWFGEPTSLHSIWDSSFIESVRKWSYTEWKENIDYAGPETRKEIASGTIYDWFTETVEVCKSLYDYAEQGENYSWKYMFDNYPLLELQLQRGGYRLAALLNKLYGE